MAAAQVLKVANTVDDRVQGIDDWVRAVDEKIAAVVDGAQYIFNQSSQIWLNNNAHRWKSGQSRHATSSR